MAAAKEKSPSRLSAWFAPILFLLVAVAAAAPASASMTRALETRAWEKTSSPLDSRLDESLQLLNLHQQNATVGYDSVLGSPLAAESGTGALDTIPEGQRITTYYPPNNGFAETPVTQTLQPGELMDRYGLDSGSYAAPTGTPPYMNSLPPGATDGPFSTFRVVQPLDVQSGTSAPWFGQPGGGTQYQLPQSIQSLLKAGYIERVGG